MKTAALFTATFALLGLAGPAGAETQFSLARQCFDIISGGEVSDGCRAIQTEYHARIDSCLAAARQLASASAAPGKRLNSHGFRARYTNCATQARNSFGPYGLLRTE